MGGMVKIICKMVYPGIDGIEEKLLFRSLGDQNRRQRLGCGFMFKEGVTQDEKDSVFSTYALVYVIRGRGEYTGPDNIVRPLRKGTLFQRFPGVLHSTILDPQSQWAECFMDFGPELFHSLQLLRAVNPEEFTLEIRDGGRVEHAFFYYLQELERAEERDLPRLSLEMMHFAASLIQQGRQEQKDFHWGMVEQSCRDFGLLAAERVDLREYCRQNGWGYEQFRKSFTRKMGISPKHYLIQRRVDEACRLLRSYRYSVKEVASLLGYSSPFEFSAQFKKVTGFSPSQFGRS